MTTAVVVAGAVANKLFSGGEAWVRMSWARAFARLGFDVRFVEQVVSPTAEQVQYFSDVMSFFDFADRATLVDNGRTVAGPDAESLFDLATDAVLVNISGHLSGPLLDAFGQRVYVDIDPGFTQIWNEQGLVGDVLHRHDRHLTIGENIGTKRCSLPTGGFTWRPVRQPVLLDDWPESNPANPARFTTVANWRGPFGPLEWNGQTYGLKVHEFRKFLELPTKARHTFELALAIDEKDVADREALVQHGWVLTDPGAASATPEAFRHYVLASMAEFSVAQGIYVSSNCGWFSDRTVRYLAAGKPALVQDTGFSDRLPVGSGLLAFRTPEDAMRGADDIVANYDEHSAEARSIAAAYFAPEVLADALD